MAIDTERGVVRVIGTDDAVRVSINRTYSRGSGETCVITYKGTKTPVEDVYNQYIADIDNDTNPICNATYHYEGGEATVVVTYPSNETSKWVTDLVDGALAVSWEVTPRDITTDIRAHSDFNAAALQTLLDEIKNQFETGQDTSAVAGQPQEDYLTLLRYGVTEYIRSAPIIRKTTTATAKSKVKAVWTGVDTAVTITTIDPPTALLGSFTGLPDYNSTKKQWLVKAPTVRQVDRDHYDITQDWQFAKCWSVRLYGGDGEIP